MLLYFDRVPYRNESKFYIALDMVLFNNTFQNKKIEIIKVIISEQMINFYKQILHYNVIKCLQIINSISGRKLGRSE